MAGAERGARVLARGDKRRDLVNGALAVFARDGYMRASIDAIAREADVSTRTIYNQFGGKAALFETVINESAQRVAEAQMATMQRYLAKVVDIEADLIEFARVWATPMPEFLPHFALVRQINAEAGHIPQAALDAWQRTGPLRVRRELARHFRRLADQGQLRIDDADLAAAHFVFLVAGDVAAKTYQGAKSIPTRQIHRLADAGVRAFLYGYAPRSGGGVRR